MLGSLVLAARAADVSLYAVFKRQVFLQADSGVPALQSSPCSGSSFLNVVVELAAPDSVAAVTLTTGTSSPSPLFRWYNNEFLPPRWVFALSAAFPNQAALDLALPNGDYALSIAATNDGLKSLTLNLTGDAYPPPPHIQNWPETQTVDASKDFGLKWDAYAGGTANDFIFVSVRKLTNGDPLFSTPFLETAGHLDGTATSVILPAGTLQPGETYDAYVRFDKILTRDTASYPGAVGSASYARGTHFNLKVATAGALSPLGNTHPNPPPPLNRPVLISIFSPDPIAAEGTNCQSRMMHIPPVITNFWSGWTNFAAPNTATFVVMRSNVATNDLTVAYSIGGTATNGVDYQMLPGSVTIPAGCRTARITLMPIPNADPVPRPMETVVLRLQAPTNLPPEYGLARPNKAAAIIVGKDEPCPWTRLFRDGSFHCELPATNGFWFRVEYSVDLLNWSAVCTNVLSRAAVHFVDPEADNSAQRYYRAVPVTVAPQWPE